MGRSRLDIETRTLGLRVTKKFADEIQGDRKFSTIMSNNLYEWYLKNHSIEELDALNKGFKPYEDWKFYKNGGN
jgi:hypothetical protein